MTDDALPQCIRGAPAMTAFGRALAAALAPGTVVALRGELGAGKTTLVRGIASGLGVEPGAVSSPTFVLMHVHDDAAGAPRLVHVDAWRIDDPAELAELGWEDLLADGRAVVAIEWPERVEAALPRPHVEIAIDHGPGEGERTVRVRRVE